VDAQGLGYREPIDQMVYFIILDTHISRELKAKAKIGPESAGAKLVGWAASFYIIPNGRRSNYRGRQTTDAR